MKCTCWFNKHGELIYREDACPLHDNEGAKMNDEQVTNTAVEMQASEALYALMGYLTTRDEPITFGAKHDAAIGAEIVDAFCKQNCLREPSGDWAERIVPFKFPAA